MHHTIRFMQMWLQMEDHIDKKHDKSYLEYICVDEMRKLLSPH